MLKVSRASLQTFIDMPNCVLEDRVQYRTVHIPNVFCDGHLQIMNCVRIVRIHWVFLIAQRIFDNSVSFNIVKYRVSKSPSACVEMKIYVSVQITVNESVLDFCPGGNAKFHLADGSVANVTKPVLMWLSQLQHSITPCVQGRRRTVHPPFTGLNFYHNFDSCRDSRVIQAYCVYA
jgi:hypothetical protein